MVKEVTLKRLLMTGAFMLASFSTAQALECQRELPKIGTGIGLIESSTAHVLYAGKSMLSKSLLHWRAECSPA